MKPWIKILIGVAIGFGAGFGSGFFCHKKMSEVAFEEVTEEEMQELEKKFLESASTNEEKPVNSTIEKADPQNEDELRNAMQGKISYVKADRDAKEKYASAWGSIVKYSDMDNADKLPVEDEPFDPEEGFDEEFLETLEQEFVEPGQVMPPHPITLGEFYNERPEYDKITIDWYEEDGDFRDEMEEIIENAESYVGMDVAKLFGKNTDGEDPDVRFVRNEEYGTDYEIIRHHQSYRELTGED